MSNHHFSRREFLGTILAGLAAGSSCISKQQNNHPGGIPTRPLGHTGEQLSILCLGGWDVAVHKDKAVSIMHEAIDNGINFFDNCWEYHDGYAEEVMGEALHQNGYRDKVFLMTKVCGRNYKDAKQHLEDSLTRLKTDVIDLWQFHAIKWEDDPKLVMDRENGALRAALEAKKEGKIRYIGFTGHADPDIHLQMLDYDFQWDAVQIPLNVLDAHYRSFQHHVMPVLNEKNIGVLGMKSLAAQDGRIVRDLGISANIARRYSMSLPITSLVAGIQTREELLHDIELAKDFQPLTEEEVKEVLAVSEEEAQDGMIERYKTGDYGCNWHHNKYT